MAFDFLSHAVRTKEILGILVRYGFAQLVGQIDLPAGFIQRFVERRRDRRTPWERVRLALQEIGPTGVKFGQLLSMRPDLVPQPLVLELRKLQDSVAPVSFAAVRQVLEEEFEQDLDAVFATMDPEPVASGSIAQVHFAILREGMTQVAVKVQRPGIQRPMEADFAIVAWLANQLHQRVESLRHYNLPGVVEEIRSAFLQELDFTHEARNQRYFRALNPSPHEIFAPEVFEEFSTRRVLVMERVLGRRIEAGAFPPEEARHLARTGARSLLHQILISGYFHADPHAGNVVVAADGRLCLLDWGLAGHLTQRMRYALADFFVAAASQDAEAIVGIATALAAGSSRPDLRTMEKEVTLAMREHFNRAIGRQETGRFVIRLLNIFGRNGISLTRDYSLMAKAVLSVEELGRTLDPEFDLATAVRPVLVQLQRERFSLRGGWRRLRLNLAASLLRLRDLPGELERIVRRVEADELTINLRHRGLEELDDAINAASNRLTLGVILAAIIVGSSLVITTRVEPFLFGYPALGIIGYLLSAVLGLWVVVDILRHGRHR